MDERPIGVFDSGIGGLTVAKEIMDKDITLEEYLGAVKAADVPRILREGH